VFIKGKNKCSYAIKLEGNPYKMLSNSSRLIAYT